MSSMQEQLVRRYQRLLRELAASSSARRPAAGPAGPAADLLRRAPSSRGTTERHAAARARLRDLADARYD
jgi:hypothetical protein